jgi:hypothetical protein
MPCAYEYKVNSIIEVNTGDGFQVGGLIYDTFTYDFGIVTKIIKIDKVIDEDIKDYCEVDHYDIFEVYALLEKEVERIGPSFWQPVTKFNINSIIKNSGNNKKHKL